MSAAAAFARTPADVEAMKADAWAAYVSDYTLAIDDDPADARARYRQRLDAIERIERSMEAGQ